MRKGISPIVAVVLLIAISVIGAVGAYFWVGGLVTQQPSTSKPVVINADPLGNGDILITNLGQSTFDGTLYSTDPNITLDCPTILPSQRGVCNVTGITNADSFHIYAPGASAILLETAAVFPDQTGGIWRAPHEYTWTNGLGTGVWEDGRNWGQAERRDYPQGNGHKVIFNSGATADCTTSEAITVGQMDIQSGYTGTITLGGALTIDDASSQNGYVTVGAGTLNTGGYALSVDGLTDITGLFVVSGSTFSANSDVTVNSGGILTFDGQTDSTPAILSLANGATLANSGTVNQTGTGSTGYAGLTGVSAEPMTGTQPAFGDGYWKVSQIDFQMDIVTGGSSSTLEFIGDSTIDRVGISANDIFKVVTAGVTITGNSAKAIVPSGTLEVTGALSNPVTFTNIQTIEALAGSTIDIQYCSISGSREAFRIGGDSVTVTQIDNCVFTTVSSDRGGLFSADTVNTHTISNSIFSGGDDSAWSYTDIYLFTGVGLILDNATFTTVGLQDTSGWLLHKDDSSNFEVWGILASSETPSAGYRAADITGDFTLSNADAYSTPFNTAYTLGANAIGIDDLIIGASTTFDTGGASYDLTVTGSTTVAGTLTPGTSTLIFTGDVTVNAGGTFGGNSAYNMDCNGAFTMVGASTFNSPTGAGTFTVAGDLTGSSTMTWSNNGGFVVLDGVTQTYSGFTSTARAPSHVRFETSTTLTLTGTCVVGRQSNSALTFNMAGDIVDGGSGSLQWWPGSSGTTPLLTCTSMPSTFGVPFSVYPWSSFNIPASIWNITGNFKFSGLGYGLTLTGDVTINSTGDYIHKHYSSGMTGPIVNVNTRTFTVDADNVIVGDGIRHGTIVVSTGTINITATTGTTIGASSNLGSNASYVLDCNSPITISGTLNLPDAGGTCTFSGATWTEGGTVNANGGLVTFDKVGTTSLGSNAASFYSIAIASGTTLDTGASYNLTVASANVLAGGTLEVAAGSTFTCGGAPTAGPTTINGPYSC